MCSYIYYLINIEVWVLLENEKFYPRWMNKIFLNNEIMESPKYFKIVILFEKDLTSETQRKSNLTIRFL